MRILFFTQYFFPETEIGGIRIRELCRYLLGQGHKVTVLTGLPNYPSGRLRADYRRKAWKLSWTEHIDGIEVVRVVLYPSHSKKSIPRLANYLSFAATASLRSLAMRGLDVVVATSPPLTVAVPAWVFSATHQLPLVMDIRDLWPESAIQLGYLRNTIARRAAEGLERFIYRRATKIVAVSEGIGSDIVSRGLGESKCHVLTNGIDTSLFNPNAGSAYIEGLKKQGQTVGIYVGTLSAYHGLDHAIELLEHLRSSSHVKIVFAGDGSATPEFRRLAQERGLTNVIFTPAPSRDEMPGLIASADFSLAFVKQSEFSRWLLSSKVFMYMSCGRPIFAVASGETRRVIEEAGGGFVAEPTSEGIRSLAEAIVRASRERTFTSLGWKGRRYAESRCSWEAIAKGYERVLFETVQPLSFRARGVPQAL